MEGVVKGTSTAIAIAILLAAAQAAAFPSKAAEKVQKDGQDLGLVGVVNINTASHEQLELLPGTGPSKSKAIVAYRVKKPFKDPRHLVRVKGIGRKTLNRILPLLVVKGATTIKKKK
jgi:competence ComEA-like helix-hairpin-helix protein